MSDTKVRQRVDGRVLVSLNREEGATHLELAPAEAQELCDALTCRLMPRFRVEPCWDLRRIDVYTMGVAGVFQKTPLLTPYECRRLAAELVQAAGWIDGEAA